MEFKDKKAWNKGLKKNKDAYGAEVYRFAEDWANLMESRMSKGGHLNDIAEETSFEVAGGITGFMYGCAVSILSGVWKYGEELRKWHNLDAQIGNEGEKANESGAVLNPALMTIG